MRRRTGGVGLLLIVFGASTVAILTRGERAWPQALPGVLFGLSMIAFGWSSLSRGRRGE